MDDLDKVKDRRAGEEQVQVINSRLSLYVYGLPHFAQQTADMIELVG